MQKLRRLMYLRVVYFNRGTDSANEAHKFFVRVDTHTTMPLRLPTRGTQRPYIITITIIKFVFAKYVNLSS